MSNLIEQANKNLRPSLLNESTVVRTTEEPIIRLIYEPGTIGRGGVEVRHMMSDLPLLSGLGISLESSDPWDGAGVSALPRAKVPVSLSLMEGCSKL